MPDAAADIATSTVEASVTILARPETVFRFLSDPEWFARWMGAGSSVEAQPGGAIRIHYPQGQIGVGRVVEIDPPRRVVFSFGFEGSAEVAPESTTVEVTLADTAEGTRVVLRHRDLPEAAMAWGSQQGWRYALSVLADRGVTAQFGNRLEGLAEDWVAAWSERDPARRRALLERCIAHNGTFRDGFAVASGIDELDDRIATGQAFGPSGRLERNGPVQLVQGALRFGWRITGPDGALIGQGTNVGELTMDGVLRSVVGFWDAAA